jgi:hypothetical protein
LSSIEGWKKLKDTIAASDNWSGDKRYYYIAKQTCHSANYGIKAPTFQMNVLLKSEGSVALTIKQCNDFLGMYHDLFPEIRQWHCDVEHQLNNGRVLSNLFGYPRRFHEPTGPELFKQGYAFVPQSTVGCITAIAITELQERIENGDELLSTGFDILQDGHDSILWQGHEHKLCDLGREVKRHLERELTSPRGERFKMGSEFSAGSNWGPKTSYNPNGLEEVKL